MPWIIGTNRKVWLAASGGGGVSVNAPLGHRFSIRSLSSCPPSCSYWPPWRHRLEEIEIMHPTMRSKTMTTNYTNKIHWLMWKSHSVQVHHPLCLLVQPAIKMMMSMSTFGERRQPYQVCKYSLWSLHFGCSTWIRPLPMFWTRDDKATPLFIGYAVPSTYRWVEMWDSYAGKSRDMYVTGFELCTVCLYLQG